MKTFFVLFCALLLTARAFAAAPETVDGSIYYESYSVIGVGIARSATSFAVTLKSDGTYAALFVLSNDFAGGPYVSSHADGTYAYKKIDNQAAELTLSGFPQNFSASPLRTLKFTSDTSGTIPLTPGDMFTNGHIFRFGQPGSPPPLVNCSNRSFVRAGGIAFTGFVISPGESRAVLVRAIGPGLTPFGVIDALGNPRISVASATTNFAVAANDDWSSDPATPPAFTGRADAIKRTSAAVGAFPLAENSKDAVVILNLSPGAYIAQVSSPDSADSGQALIEVYMLP